VEGVISQFWMDAILVQYVTMFGSLNLRVRLFKNDLTLSDDLEFADFDECDFSGYDGYHDVSTWSAGGIVFVPPRMVLPGPYTTWYAASGGTENDVFGYYVTDDSDNFLWAQKGPVGGTHMGDVVGLPYTVALQYAVRSEFNSTEE